MEIPLIARTSINISMYNGQKNLISDQSLIEETINQPNSNSAADNVSISVAARNAAQEKDPLTPKIDDFYTAMELLKNLNETAEAREDGFTERLKCIKIALRIIRGDKVPLKDMAFLAEKEPAMYSNAILLKRSNDNPKKHKSLINEEKKDSSTDSLDANAPPEIVAPETIAGDAINVEDVEVSVELGS
ncbi:MAG TPA: hypothetical protein VFD02_03190 [Syntrophomonadaceae bacterium]|nr:hypothetical protein [Syntrophomonadaceae bacterium]